MERLAQVAGKLLERLDLQRPLVCISTDTTGLDVENDKVVQLVMVKVHPSGQVECWEPSIDPGVPIPAAAAAVHGITQAMVKGCPSFEALSGQLHAFLDGCDLAGYNVRRFAVPMLTAEFKECDMQFPAPGTRVVDLMRIFHKQEPRDLAGAVQFFLNRLYSREQALDAAAAAVEVLAEMVVRYDLPREVSALEAFACGDDATLDGRLKWAKSEDGQDVILFDFGKYKGQTLEFVIEADGSYITWMHQTYPATRAILEDAVEGRLYELHQPPPRERQAPSRPTTHSATRLLAVVNTLASRAGEQVEQLLQQQQQKSSQAADLPAELLQQVSQLAQLANKLQLAVGGSGTGTQPLAG